MKRTEEQWREDIIGGTVDGNRLSGRVYEDDDYWIIEFPHIDLMTQARSRGEICEMVKDLLETLANCPTYSVNVSLLEGHRVEVTSSYRPAARNSYAAQTHRTPAGGLSRPAAVDLAVGNRSGR